MKLESYISMAYTMAYVAAMMNAALWVFKSDRPETKTPLNSKG